MRRRWLWRNCPPFRFEAAVKDFAASRESQNVVLAVGLRGMEGDGGIGCAAAHARSTDGTSDFHAREDVPKPRLPRHGPPGDVQRQIGAVDPYRLDAQHDSYFRRAYSLRHSEQTAPDAAAAAFPT